MPNANKNILGTNNVKTEVSKMLKQILVRGENRSKCRTYCSNMIIDLSPQTETQKILAKKIIYWGWKQLRLIEMETRFLSEQNTPSLTISEDWSEEKKIKRIRSLDHVQIDSLELKDLHMKQIALEKVFSKSLKQYRAEQEILLNKVL
jgi:hypothetical protein